MGNTAEPMRTPCTSGGPASSDYSAPTGALVIGVPAQRPTGASVPAVGGFSAATFIVCLTITSAAVTGFRHLLWRGFPFHFLDLMVIAHSNPRGLQLTMTR